MVLTPVVQERTGVEEHRREFLEREGGQLGILLPDEVFVEPMTGKSESGE